MNPPIPESTKEQVRRLLREGKDLPTISRATELAHSTIRGIARTSGIAYTKVKPAPKYVPIQVTTDENWQGKARALRWGYQLGQGRW